MSEHTSEREEKAPPSAEKYQDTSQDTSREEDAFEVAVQPDMVTDESISVYSLEAGYAAADEQRNATGAQAIDTAHTDGSTSDPHQAQEQGLVYDPPSDPPVLPSDDLQGAEVAAGFASSMEETNPNVMVLPERVDNQDLDLESDIRTALRYNSETSHLHDIAVTVREGVAYLEGTVVSDDDIAIVDYLVRGLTGIRDVRNDLQVADIQ